MRKCKVTGRHMSFGPGSILEMTKDQAEPRMHNLTKVEEGVYRVERTIQFKNGETFGYDGEIPKIQYSNMEPVEDETGSEDEKGEVDSEYEAMEVKSLRIEARKRKLNFQLESGKTKMIALLLQDDQKE